MKTGKISSTKKPEKEIKDFLSDIILGFNSGYFTHDFSLQTLTDSKTRKIPKDSYLILNDNRQNTRDSREFGLISSKQIQGVISFRISPLKKFGFIENK